MHIKRIHLEKYKRFTDLIISEVPESARLVVLVGPNGSGKSSVIDSFLLKAEASYTNYALVNQRFAQYHEKVKTTAHSIREIANHVTIDFHDKNFDLRTAFHVRSAYRNESDFYIEQLNRINRETEASRLKRIIDVDTSVSRNYTHIAWRTIQDTWSDGSPDTTFKEYRDGFGKLKEVMLSMFQSPELLLQDFGGLERSSFRFAKGNVKDFHYKNFRVEKKRYLIFF